ncbi:MAG: GGDEF domain-containing protein [Actinomycetota bacterium]
MLRVASSINCDKDYLERHASISQSTELLETILRGTRPVRLPAGAAPAALSRLTASVPGNWSLLAPIVSAPGAQGLLTLIFPVSQAHDDSVDDWLSTWGTLVGTSVSNARVFKEVDNRSRTDALTGLGTRRHFEELMRRELARARRAGTPLSLAMLDVDGLKRINDEWGHVMGDKVLQAVGSVLEHTRATDVAARFGGDEFVLLMPDTTAEEAAQVGERFRAACEKINGEGRFPFPIAVSIGIRQMTHLDGDLVSEADAAMYANKRSQTNLRTLAFNAAAEDEEAEVEAPRCE